jgi:hypothetical protein
MHDEYTIPPINTLPMMYRIVSTRCVPKPFTLPNDGLRIA